jgi:adenylylsulfate kinase
VALKILIMGLPGAGKTSLAQDVSKALEAVHWNADEVRNNINEELGFSKDDRVTQARRMGWLCDQVVKSGTNAVADFVCPTEETRAAFGSADFVVWMDTIKESRYEDTNKVFVPPQHYDLRFNQLYKPDMMVDKVVQHVSFRLNEIP